MRRFLSGAAVSLVIYASPVAAQEASPPIAPAALVIPSAQPAGAPVLRTGTQIQLTLLEQLTTRGKNLRVGERFRLETSEPVLVDGIAVIPVGTPAIGEITEVRNKGMWGRSGRFVARLVYLNVPGRRIRLSGEFDDKGKAGGAGAVAVSALVFLPAGFFMTGTSALLPPGTQISGFIDEDVPLAVQGDAAGSSVPSVSQIAVADERSALPEPNVVPREEAGNARVRCLTCR